MRIQRVLKKLNNEYLRKKVYRVNFYYMSSSKLFHFNCCDISSMDRDSRSAIDIHTDPKLINSSFDASNCEILI